MARALQPPLGLQVRRVSLPMECSLARRRGLLRWQFGILSSLGAVTFGFIAYAVFHDGLQALILHGTYVAVALLAVVQTFGAAVRLKRLGEERA